MSITKIGSLKNRLFPGLGRIYVYIIPVLITRLLSYDLFLVPYMSRYVSLDYIGLSYTITFAIGPIVTLAYGRLIDSRGRLLGLLISMAMALVSQISVVELSSSKSLALGLALFSIVGLSLAANWIMMALRILVSDATTGNKRAQSWGWLLSTLSIVRPAASIVAGFLAAIDYRLLFVAAGGLFATASVIYFVLILYRRNKTTSQPLPTQRKGLLSEFRQLLSLVRNRNVLLYMIIVSIEAPYFSIEYQTLYLVNVLGVDTRVLGIAFAGSSIISIFSPILGGHLARKIGMKRGMLVGQLVLGTSVLSYVLASRPEHVFVIEVLAGFVPLYWPSRDMYVLGFIPDKMKGQVLSVQNLFFSIVLTPAPYLGSILWLGVSPQSVFILDILLTALSSGLTLSLATLGREHETQHVEASEVASG